MHLAAIELHAAGLLDRLGDVLRRDGPEQPAVVTRRLRDGEHRPRQQRRVLLRALGELALGALLRLDPPLGVGNRRGCGRLSQLPRQQEVAQVALRDVDHVAALADVLNVLEENRLGHLGLPVRDVREQAELASTLDGDRELALVAPAVAGDTGRADLALLAHSPPQRSEVLVVDDVDLVAAELARLAPAAATLALLVTPATLGRGPATLLRHAKSSLRLSQNGMSSSVPWLDPALAIWKSLVSAGTSDGDWNRCPPPLPPSSRPPRN